MMRLEPNSLTRHGNSFSDTRTKELRKDSVITTREVQKGLGSSLSIGDYLIAPKGVV